MSMRKARIKNNYHASVGKDLLEKSQRQWFWISTCLGLWAEGGADSSGTGVWGPVWSGGGVSAFVKTQRTALGKEWVEGQRGRAASRHLLLQDQADGPPLPLSAFCWLCCSLLFFFIFCLPLGSLFFWTMYSQGGFCRYCTSGFFSE